MPVAINVSPLQLKNTALEQILSKFLQDYSMDSRLVELEFTENIFIDFDEKISNTRSL